MGTYILTSRFSNGFNDNVAKVFQKVIKKKSKFAFVASEFEKMHEKTDYYFKCFLDMFAAIDIHFEESCVVDGRISPENAQKNVEDADVIWLSGGDTPVAFNYLKTYQLDKVIKNHKGVVIGMSAGSINMAKTAICTLSCGHRIQKIYEGLGCVKISVEPHFTRDQVSDELLKLSKEYVIYGLCDESAIICNDDKMDFFGEVYEISSGKVIRVN